jgi:hypothetical protein
MKTFNKCQFGRPFNEIRNLEMCPFIGLRIGTMAGCCEHSNEHSVFIRDRKYLG